jgi:hypothetical protein
VLQQLSHQTVGSKHGKICTGAWGHLYNYEYQTTNACHNLISS